ncbi:MAG: UvrD-helicase domain-containing protein [Hylemonella sp.]|nr:UvrD-helicase domain-containing protein [Hylemonella sp.]MDP1938532.1 UvrD-helicase domain-containing protein [Hylemonella sp.]
MTPAYELNGHPVSREDFYAIACDPRRSVAVEACAGAGKTWMLVSRILRALLEGAAPHEILAITFTKKAAGEMRQRLTEWLEEFAKATPEQLEKELLIRGIGLQASRELREPLQNLYQTLLAQGRPVQIRTFHSWFAALLRTAPLSVLEALGLPTAYELLEDDAQAVAQVWRPFHARLLREPEARQDYEAVVATHGRFQTERALEAALHRRVEFALADAQGAVLASVPHFSEQFPEFSGVEEPLAVLLAEGPLRQQLQQAAQTLGRASQPSFSAKGSELEQALTANDADGVLAALLTQSGTGRKFGDKVAGIEQVRAVQEQVLAVLAAQAQHQAWLYQQRMTRLTRLLIDEFAALKRERGWVDMNDVERAALHQLSDPVLGGWVQERLDARTRHLLIDEFQDTNPLQWQALHAWLSAYAGAGGGAEAPSLFIVGDPKQSIYRFRRAEPQVFIAAQAFVRDLGGDLLSCDHTRRNAPAVLALVNQAMGQAQADGLYPGFRSHTTESQEAGGTYVLPQILRPEKTSAEEGPQGWRDSLTTPRVTPEETLRTLECRQAAQWLAAQIEDGLRPRDIMVLSRKRDRLAVMQEELRALGIPAQQPEKRDLGQAPEVQDIVALLDALVSPAHDLSLARALKSPLFGVSDDELVQLALLQRQHKLPWFDLLQKEELLAPSLQAAGLILTRWKGWLDTLPPHDALDAIFDDGDVLARCVAAAPVTQREAVLSNLQALLAAALQVDGARYATPYALVRALKAGGVPAPTLADADAVRLLTVHGAKGLEASLVLLLDTDAPPPKAQTMSVLLDWPGEAEAPQSFVFLASESNVPPSVQPALATEQQARQREELNALYVAMTRAQQRLVLSSVQPHQANGASWWQRLQAGCTAIEVPAAPAPVAVVPASDAPILLPILPSVLVTSAPIAIKTGASQGVAEKPTPESLIGQAMHRLLEWAVLDAAGWTPAQVQRAAAEFGLDATQAQQAAAMAQRILLGDGAWAWRADAVDWHGNEVPVTVQGSVRRIDRLVRRKTGTNVGEWWVLDYKSAAQPQGNHELLAQLRSYRAAVQAASPGELVRAAFLSAAGTLEEIQGNE